ncbi:MAG: hypothetical protein RLY71_3752 [Pseudomonadota bacterium]|jgi:hypothetical protein
MNSKQKMGLAGYVPNPACSTVGVLCEHFMKFTARIVIVVMVAGLLTAFAGCTASKRTIPYPILSKDYFGDHLPGKDRSFIYVNGVAPSWGNLKFIYLVDVTPPEIKQENRELYRKTTMEALRSLGFTRIVLKEDMVAMLKDKGVQFRLDRHPSQDEMKTLNEQDGPFVVLTTSYGFSMGGRRFFKMHVVNPSSGEPLFVSSYDTVIWNDVKNELILPGINIFANWMNGGISMKMP